MDLHLPTPDKFPAFPYDPPYDIQADLMQHLYKSIEDKKVTIVESPTGTVSHDLASRARRVLTFVTVPGEDFDAALCFADLASG